jgi:predicted enzyme related to lactoylglutathione lyase
MTSQFRNITFDCADARGLAAFWSQVVGWNLYYDDDPEVVVTLSYPPQRGATPSMLFIPVPEGKTAKNRVHLDIAPTDCTRDEEVARLIGLGATQIDDHRSPDGAGWVVLADPEGNEFCVERSDAERGPATPRHYRISSD